MTTRYGWPWTPTATGSDDGDYGPDQIVTCQTCGAAVDDRPEQSARELHDEWHRRIEKALHDMEKENADD